MTRADWKVTPSFRYDTLCLLNTLTGDPFYVGFNEQAYATFKPRLTQDAEHALAELKRIIKDEGKSIISALLCLNYSAVEGEILPEMLAVLDDPAAMKAGLQASPYFSATNWQLFLDSREHLRVIFRFLEAIDFAAYWRAEILPQITPEVEKIEAYLAEYDVVAQLEAMIGYRLPSPLIEVSVLHYSRPHGIKVIGQRFLTGASWHPQIALRTAIHEMLHPPYDLNADAELQSLLNQLEQDPFIAEKFTTHNPDFGYNTFTGYVEENCVRALDQLVSESFEVARDARERWREEDGGMHVLAAVLYHHMKTAGFRGGFREFFVSALQAQLAPGRVQAVYDDFYALDR